MLKDRNTHIIKGNMTKLEELEKNMTHLFKNRFDEIKRPVVAFVIFETQEARERCLNYFETDNSYFGSV